MVQSVLTMEIYMEHGIWKAQTCGTQYGNMEHGMWKKQEKTYGTQQQRVSEVSWYVPPFNESCTYF